MINIEKLKEIAGVGGISSCEQEIAEILAEEYRSLGLSCRRDGLGSLIAEKCTDRKGPKMMVAAHMDEVGFMVREIDEQGFIRLQAIGSWWSHMVLGQWYTIITAEHKRYNALMGSKATHGLPAEVKNKTVSLEDIYLDLGAGSRQEVLELGVSIGDMVVPMAHFEVMNNPDYLSCKAFDDRIGNFIMIEVAQRLMDTVHTPLYFANTVQEEPGLRGARTATETVHPDIAFAIDTTLAGDTPMDHNICALGKGVVLSMIDSNSIAPRGLVRFVESVCRKNDIRYQYAVFNKGGTDSGNIHKAFEGVLSMTLSIPIRYMHTNHSIIHKKDVEACIRLICGLAREMDEKVYEKIWKEQEGYLCME